MAIMGWFVLGSRAGHILRRVLKPSDLVPTLPHLNALPWRVSPPTGTSCTAALAWGQLAFTLFSVLNTCAESCDKSIDLILSSLYGKKSSKKKIQLSGGREGEPWELELFNLEMRHIISTQPSMGKMMWSQQEAPQFRFLCELEGKISINMVYAKHCLCRSVCGTFLQYKTTFTSALSIPFSFCVLM